MEIKNGADLKKLDEGFHLVLDGKAYPRDRIIRAINVYEDSIRRISNARRNRKAREAAKKAGVPQN